MGNLTVINGLNFSGRSKLLGDILLRTPDTTQPFFLGLYAETGLSGFAATVMDEFDFYGVSGKSAPTPWSSKFAERLLQNVSALSGGEQVMLGITCLAAQSENVHIGIDCALEQLDARNRTLAIEVLSNLHGSDISLIDHRLDEEQLKVAPRLECNAEEAIFELKLSNAISMESFSANAPTIKLSHLSFAYKNGHQVFDDCEATLEPGRIFRLIGDNGSGKSTLLKLLCGVLRAQRGSIRLDDKISYEPYRTGNHLIGYAMQNPDDQWVAPTLLGDCSTRTSRLRQLCKGVLPDSDAILLHDRLNRLMQALCIDIDVDSHVLDLPRVLRKRLSWLWALSGTMPWIVLDEPTLGQDINAVSQLATVLTTFAQRGYGVVVISHDPRLLSRIDSINLTIKQHRLNLDI